MKKIIAAVSVVAIAVAGYFSYSKYEERKLIDTLVPHVKNTTIRIANSSRLELEPTQITFKELFEKLDADVAEMEKRSIEVQSVSNAKNVAVIAPVTQYLQSAQEYSRALSMKYRKQLAMSNAVDHYRDAVTDQINSNGYGREYAVNRANKAEADARKAADEADSSTKAFTESVKKLKTACVAVATVIPTDAIIPAKQLDDLIGKNTPKEKPKS